MNARGSIGQIMTGRDVLNRALAVPTCSFGETAVTCTRQFVSESGTLKDAVACPFLSVRRVAVQKALSAKSRRTTSSPIPSPGRGAPIGPTPAPGGGSDVNSPNCGPARAVGGAPIYRGLPNYGDGIPCQ